MASRTHTRMSREARRTQLLELGKQAVMASSFDEVSVEQVADAAGISRGLLFHYFPTRRDFLHAVAEAAAEELLALTEPRPELPPLERLQASMDAFVDYVLDHGDAYVSVVRGAAGGDPAMLAVVTDTRREIVERTATALGLSGDHVTTRLRMGLHGWLGLVEEATLAWLDAREADRPGRDALLELCQHTLLATLTASGLDAGDVLANA